MSKTKDRSENMSFTCSYDYKMVKNITSLAGQWPYQKQRTKLLCLSLVTLSTCSIMAPQIARFVICSGDLNCILQTLAAYLLTIVTLIKLYTCYFNRYKMKILVDQLFIEWDKLKTPEEYEIMKTYAETGKRYTLRYSLCIFISAYIFCSLSLIPYIMDIILPLNNSRPILTVTPSYYFIDEREYFFYIYSHAIVAWEITVSGIVAHDCFLLTYIEHICSIFTIIGFRFEQLMYKHTDTGKILPSYSSDIYRKQIAFTVDMHQKVLKFAHLLEDVFSLSLAMQIALNTISISITLLQITQDTSDTLIVIRYIVYIAVLLLHLFCLSFEGQKLIDHSLRTRDKIYNSLWYKTSPKSQKMLLFVMQKTFQPISLSACKIYIFSMENFTTIMQTSMSYFTVLASME
ncbi:odorant receptor 4-like [Linepithema humile]|uniref:odorant receptor 4-like n=1 Tax=Linepithema humile TaxID=83485 RepID=UPI00351E6291